WLYSRQTENVAYEQLHTGSRLLVPSLVAEQHHTGPAQEAMADLRRRWDRKIWPGDPSAPADADEARRREKGYYRSFIRPDDPEKRPQDSAGYEQLREFQNDPNRDEFNQLLLSQGQNHYYAAIRATESCIGCHKTAK